ncbi:LPS export ABC transporter periplasmic protein LptC [Flavobacterium litorale]|uniref:LPS export ABC transporter periplasmic protein LptC n=1 Tax=Flavobacterium litorale TaxID=2856519 RepID=A0ABX8V986_9FLAO|nr:LPS export ABC transporter periplasmic protein LptC [Flavobacterium litorale]QYJ69406.1 LPS export ABC transporter periplasmic protein LptC [Flavobacterium litorale]
MRQFVRAIVLFVIIASGFLISCETNFKDVQRINTVAFAPAARSEDINLKYTDSGKVKAILVSPLMLDYSNMQYKFNEFPEGIHLTLIDKSGKNSFVVSDYAISYDDTHIIDLQGNVKITSYDGKELQAPQLYYDQKNEWFYTEKSFKFTDGKESFIQGVGIDFSKDFKVFNMQHNNGEINNVE